MEAGLHEPIWQSVRALVVEDDPAARHLYVLALHRMPLWQNLTVVECGTMAGAELALKAGPRFDIVILDLCLPNGKGLDVIRRLSYSQAFPPVIIVLTGLEMDLAHEVEGIREGAASWVRKSDLVQPGGVLDWSILERAIGYSLARRDWTGPMLIERSRRIAAESSEAVSSG